MTNSSINPATLTYRQLKELVPEAPRTKMTAKKLEGEEMVIRVQLLLPVVHS